MNEPVTKPSENPGKPKERDYFLMVIVGGIGLLTLLAIVSLFLLRPTPPEISENSPGGVAQSYINAYNNRDYDKAYDLLDSALQKRISRQNYKNSIYQQNSQNISVSIKSENINGNNASVILEIRHYNQFSPFANGESWNEDSTMSLSLENGVWRIGNLNYPYGFQYWLN
ncbi:MAG: hypothetical protein HXX08_22615 [Chloroflexi bacterium]|uniref:NTF2-like N-terminal transpeptidase domain-containing protein n=1 Tax=Candidatus Chlorohelix allophototropha TaxID=3003348 RepID=A0A8T7M9I1_9CHLR|nr:hypothetical protein [Chloroflexota bacterium]WJW68593.1 hypothetical protein OZ401_004207 [Chloroflexota bacterium L227-S17]